MINLDNYSSIFIANWKLNGNSSFLKEYYEKLKLNFDNNYPNSIVFLS